MRRTERSGNIRWLLSELPGMRKENIVTGEECGKLRVWCESRLEDHASARRILFLLIAFPGMLLLCGGLVLFLVHGWDGFPIKLRIAISFVPLVSGGFLGGYTLLKGKGAAFRESSALLTAAGAAVLIALISHIYHTDGALPEYLRLVLGLSLPLIYIFESAGLYLLYSFGLIFLTTNTGSEPPLLMLADLLYTLLPVPFAILRFREREDGFRSTLVRYAVVTGAFAFLFLPFTNVFPVFGLAAFLLFTGLLLNERGIPVMRNPNLFVGYLGTTFLLAVFCFRGNTRWTPSQEELRAAVTWAAGSVLFLTPVFWCLRHRIFRPEILLVLPIPLLILLPDGLRRPGMNLYFALSGVGFTAMGFRRNDLLELNCGTAQILLLAVCHFSVFDPDAEHWIFALISVCSMFLGINLFAARGPAKNGRGE